MWNRSTALRGKLNPRLVLAVVVLLAFASSCGSEPRAVLQSSSDETIVAKVGDREFTLDQVDERAVRTSMKAYQDLYNVRQAALEELIAETLLEWEAESRGVSVDDLVAVEITAKLAPVTEADIESFYNTNRNRLRGQTLEQMGGQIRKFLQTQNESTVRETFLDELKKDAGVTVALDPPRVRMQVADADRVKGPAEAKVTIVEYSDFQ